MDVEVSQTFIRNNNNNNNTFNLFKDVSYEKLRRQRTMKMHFILVVVFGLMASCCFLMVLRLLAVQPPDPMEFQSASIIISQNCHKSSKSVDDLSSFSIVPSSIRQHQRQRWDTTTTTTTIPSNPVQLSFPKTGDVYYSTFRDHHKHRRVYKREFTIPCNYGVLVFNIGPASKDQSFDFELYDTAYLWSNNYYMCWVYPYYSAFQMRTHQPFWKDGIDPKHQTYRNVNSDKLNHISTHININHNNTKPMDKFYAKKGGDYMIMGKGKFWDPHYWDDLRTKIHSWKKEENDDIDQLE